MAKLSKLEFKSFVEATLPDNSSREISAYDLRVTFLNLADSVVSFLDRENLRAQNFFSIDTRSISAGVDSLTRRYVNGFSSTDNTSFGYGTFEVLYSSARNTALGSQAASCLTLGSDNVAVGVNAVGSTTTGSGNVSIGNYSLMENRTGDFNIAIGHGAGYTSESNGNYRFYLGVYPEVSGECDDTMPGVNKPPLLYGDLKTLQLGIGVSGFRSDEKLSVSGDILPYENQLFHLGSSNYKWQNIYAYNVISDRFNGQEEFYRFRISDGTSPSDLISDGETITISGVSGILTDYSSNIMRVSAAPLSGVLQPQITTNDTRASGLISYNDNRASGLISYNDNRASGVISHTSGVLQPQITTNDTRASGLIASVSGTIESKLISLSGLAPNFNGSKGLIWNVSGWAASYADTIGAAAGAYTHWKISDGVNNNNITAPPGADNTLVLDGVSGVETYYRNDTNTVEISAQPLSGVLQSQVISNDERASGLIDYNDTRASGLISHTSGVLQPQITTNNTRASGLISHVSGVLQTQIVTNDTRASGLVHSSGDYLLNLIYNSGDRTRFLYELADSTYAGQSVARDNAVSGTIDSLSGLAPYFNGPSGLIWNVSGWSRGYTDNITDNLSGALKGVIDWSGNYLKSYIDNAVLASNAYTHWTIRDEDNVSDSVDSTDDVNFVGDDGISTSYSLSTKTLTIDANALSGWVENSAFNQNSRASGLIAFTSGVLDRFIDEVSGVFRADVSELEDNASGLISYVSGVFKSDINNLDNNASGLISFVSGVSDRYTHDVSGVFRREVDLITEPEIGTIDTRIDTHYLNVTQPYIDELNDAIYTQAGLSGTLQYDIDSVSGYLRTLNEINDSRASGYITAFSGVYQYDLHNDFGKLGRVSGYNQKYTDIVVATLANNIIEGYKGAWKILDQTGATARINFEDLLDVTGVDGVVTTLGGSNPNFNLTIDASPISGYLEDISYSITGIQGCFQSKIDSVSGLVNFVSGVAREAVGASGALISGWAHESFLIYNDRASGLIGYNDTRASGLISYNDNRASGLISYNDNRASGLIAYNDNRASGLITHLSGILSSEISDSGAVISGWAHQSFINYDTRASGVIDTVSGDAEYKFMTLSGIPPAFNGPSGLIWNVSGWLVRYVDQEIVDLDLLNDNYSHWRISDGTTTRNIGSLRETQFLGVSGIETRTKINGASGLFISAAPVSGILHGIIDASGQELRDYADQSETDAISKAADNALEQDTFYTNRASGLISHYDVRTSGLIAYNDNRASGLISYNDNRASGLISYNDNRASGLISYTSGTLDSYIDTVSGYLDNYIVSNDVRTSGLVDYTSGVLDSYIDTVSGYLDDYIVDNDSRASGYILATSGSLHNSAGTGLYRAPGGVFNTAGTGVFDKLALNGNTNHSIGNLMSTVVEDFQSNPYHVIVNSSGYLAVPVYENFTDLTILNRVNATVGSGTIIFAGGHLRVSDGSRWSRPTAIEGFMMEDLEAPSDYSTPTSGRIVTRNDQFQASDVYYITNRDHTFHASGGYFLTAMLINNEYRPTWSTCSGCAAEPA